MKTKNLIEAVKFQVSVKPQDDFMREVAEGLEKLYEENNRQKAEIDKLTCDYGCYKVSAADVLEQLKAEIEALIAGQKTLQKALNEKSAEVKMLQTYITNHPYRVVVENADIYTKNHEEYEKLLAKISAEAVKEFAERLDRKFAFYYSDTQCISAKTIRESIRNELKETEKEMVGEG